MRNFCAFPGHAVRLKWFGMVLIFTVSLVLTGSLPSGFAQDQQQTATQQSATQQSTAQQSVTSGLPPIPLDETGMPKITLNPVSLDSPIDLAKKDGTALSASLRDIVKLALQANLDIAIADTAEDTLQQQRIDAHASAYDPSFSGSFNWQNSKSLNTTSFDAAQSATKSTLSQRWSAQVSQNLFWGARYQFNVGGGRQDTNQVSYYSPLQYSSSYSFSFTQPLRQGFKVDQYRNAIKVVNLNLKNNDSVFRQQVSSTVAQVENAYWDLVNAISQFEATKSSVLVKRTTVDQNKKKVEVGTMAPIDVIQSLSSQSSGELQLISQSDTILQRENSLKQLISKDRSADIWGKMIVPTDKPDVVDYNVDLNNAITTALKKRPELEQYDNTLAQDDLAIQYQRNMQKWNLAFTAQLSGSSLAVPDGNPQYAPKLWGGLGTSYIYLFNTVPPTYQFGLSLSFPLFNRDNKALMAEKVIAKQKDTMNRVKQEQSIIVSVRNAVQGLVTAKHQIDTANIGAQLAQATLEADVKRLDAGLAQTFQVLQDQDSLLSAQNQQLSAIIGYRKAIITMQQAIFTLLDESNIDLGKDISRTKPYVFK